MHFDFCYIESMSYKDYTLKARLQDRKGTEEQLHAIGAVFIGLDMQTDTYFKVPPDSYRNDRLKLRQGTLGSLITHYQRMSETGVERTVVFRYDVNPSPEAIKQFLREHDRIGLVLKERRIFNLDGVLIHLDRLQTGEEFVEIEAKDHKGTISDNDLKAECLHVSRMLQIEKADIVPTGYLK